MEVLKYGIPSPITWTLQFELLNRLCLHKPEGRLYHRPPPEVQRTWRHYHDWLQHHYYLNASYGKVNLSSERHSTHPSRLFLRL